MTSHAQSNEKNLMAHTGELVSKVISAVSDDAGNVFLDTNLGPAVVHDMDLAQLDIAADNDTPILVWRGEFFPIKKAESSLAELLGFDAQPRLRSTSLTEPSAQP